MPIRDLGANNPEIHRNHPRQTISAESLIGHPLVYGDDNYTIRSVDQEFKDGKPTDNFKVIMSHDATGATKKETWQMSDVLTSITIAEQSKDLPQDPHESKGPENWGWDRKKVAAHRKKRFGK